MTKDQASKFNTIVKTIPIALAVCTLALHLPGLIPGAGPGSVAASVSAVALGLITLVRRQCEEYALGVMLRETYKEMQAIKSGQA